MKGFISDSKHIAGNSRRRFVKGLAAGGALFALAPVARSVLAATTSSVPTASLTGTVFDLEIAETPVNFTGTPRMGTSINGSIPGPTLYWREGDTVTIRVRNRLREYTSIHWHGMILPYQMDGVPGISFKGIPPGETFTYKFKVQQNGTYWYHSHSGFQEMTGIYGAIVIVPREQEIHQVDRDYAIQLSDWTDEAPMEVFKKLKAMGDYYNLNRPTVGDFRRDVGNLGLEAAVAKREMWNQMRMNPTDLGDLSSSTLTYLMNGVTPNGNWEGAFAPGERIRLRFINGTGNTFYDVRIPGLKLQVIQTDGVNIHPISVDEFRFGPGETYDVIVKPTDDAHTIFAQSMERTGFACGTLSTRPGLTAPVPQIDAPEWLDMKDMMGDMSNMASGAHNMAMDHSQHGGSAGNNNPVVSHATSEFGASTDMLVDTPRTNLDDPGIGLRNNGRRVLTLADLHGLDAFKDQREPARDIELHLTGNMERYTWSFDGLEFGKSTPIHFSHNERVRIILHNDTMMTHPMHLHGMWSELESPAGELLTRKHTIAVQPAQRISFQLTADALGRWAWHCHLLFHMDAGMFREVVVT
ncbi:MAG: CopA family copper-resistance protein [Pseudohongiellaceae bacterium]